MRTQSLTPIALAIMSNLIINAFDFTDDETEVPSLLMTLEDYPVIFKKQVCGKLTHAQQQKNIDSVYYMGAEETKTPKYVTLQ